MQYVWKRFGMGLGFRRHDETLAGGLEVERFGIDELSARIKPPAREPLTASMVCIRSNLPSRLHGR